MKAGQIISIILITLASFGYSQENVDSLWNVWNTKSKPDTARIQAMNVIIITQYMFTKPDSAEDLGEEMYQLALSANELNWAGRARNLQAITNSIRSHYEKAIEYYSESADLYMKTNDISGLAGSFNNMGIAYEEMGRLADAINVHSKCLKIAEYQLDTFKMSASYNNIARIYTDLGDRDKAFEYFQKGYDIGKEGNVLNGQIAVSLGGSYSDRGRHDEAFRLYEDAIEACTRDNDLQGLALATNSKGALLIKVGKEEEGLALLQKGLEIRREVNLPADIANSLLAFANYHIDKGEFSKAISYAEEGYEISVEYNALKAQKDLSYSLYRAYEGIGSDSKALAMLAEYMDIRDSMETEGNKKALLAQELEHEFERKEEIAATEHQLELEHQEAVSEQDRQHGNIIIGIVSGGLVIVLLFLVFLFNRFRIIRQQKQVIEVQKTVVESKNQEITDSITYAKRLQDAILPSQDTFDESFAQNFVFYKPKDIVAGDFYWLEKTNHGILVAAADCTGHGVPGAMVSVVCHGALNRAVREFGLIEPGEILDKTTDLVIETFQKSGQDVRDGMDISLCLIDPQMKSLKYAGANNNLCIVREDQLIEFKADKQPVGRYDVRQPFKTQTIELQEGDSLYLYTDGYSDQFGGLDGKKLKYKNFKKLLVERGRENMAKQKQGFSDFLFDWMGDHEQLDDVCLIGLRV